MHFNHIFPLTLLFIALLGVSSTTCAQLASVGPALEQELILERTNTGELSTRASGFEENRGQVKTTGGDPAPHVRYRLSNGGTNIFLLENGIAYQFDRMHYPEGYQELLRDERNDPAKRAQLDVLREQVKRETYRMDMVLEGVDASASITTDGRSEDYTNYYNHGVLDVHTYTKVTYHDVYPGIDWVVYTSELGMKYDFVVRPGADPSLIRLRFAHHEELHVDDDGNLIHGNRMGRFTEQRPVSFLDGHEVGTRFKLDGDLLTFDLDGYDKSQTLTIDPARIWGTYYGGGNEENTGACATDGAGNVYLAGRTASASEIAASGYQVVFAGGDEDAFLVKFSPSGVRLWATYYGGPDQDAGFGCAVDGNGDVYLSGFTLSSTMIASGGAQNSSGGDVDAFLVKFDGAGSRQWATYYGGSDFDIGFLCTTDATSNVILYGNTSSTNGIASGGHQVIYGGGISDGFVVKFNSSGGLLWGTYYGGSDQDVVFSCSVDGSGDVLVCGLTRSASGIAMGGFQNSYGGEFDAFLVKLNASGVRQWGTYYGGPADDLGFGTAIGIGNEIYLAGSTRSLTDIASGGHQNSIGGAEDAFLVKFSTGGSRIWGTYYGGPEDDAALCFIDATGNVYLSGSTESTTNIASGGHQNTYGGGLEDAFLVKFNTGGTRQWATYYGGAGWDRGYIGTTDPSGNIYLGGLTDSGSGIAAGGHQNTYGGGALDGFLVKFEGAPAACTENLTLEVETDLYGGQTTWQVFLAGTMTVAASGPLVPYGNNTTTTDNICLPVGCYELRVSDSGGDGILDGGYILRNATGQRIIDCRDNGNFGSSSQVSGGTGLCLPIGNDRLITQSCDRLDLRRGATGACSDKITADNTPNGTSGIVYQFWIYDPNGTLSLYHPSASGTTSNQVAMNQLPSLIEGRLYNVRVRTRISPGIWREWGPACRMMIDNAAGQCASTKLQDEPTNSHLSCGRTKPLGSSSTSLVFAKPVTRFNASCVSVTATKYQFRFRIPADGIVIVKNGVGTNPWTYLNTAGIVATPSPASAVLEACRTYEVEVRASFDGGVTWCRGSNPYSNLAPWGDICELYTDGCISELRVSSVLSPTAATMKLYPNPNRGDQLYLSLSEVEEGVNTITADIYDLFGRRVSAHQIAVHDLSGPTSINAVLDLQLREGMYLVNISVGEAVYTERLVIQP